MGSFKSKDSFCPIRGIWVAATPEEIVRQKLIEQMIGPLGYPRGLLCVEKDLTSLTGSSAHLVRRVDLLCFVSLPEGLKPLLLIECKAGPLNSEAENQLFGYNLQVRAPFLCLVNETETKMLWREQGRVASLPFLPTYAQLIEKI